MAFSNEGEIETYLVCAVVDGYSFRTYDVFISYSSLSNAYFISFQSV